VIRSQLARSAVLVLVVVAVGFALAANWDAVAGRLDEVSLPSVLLAIGAVVAALCCSMQAWRGLLADLGSPLRARHAARVLFVSQLGKYLPGSVWPAVAQIELAAGHQVPRDRSAAAGGALMLLTPLSGALVASALVPFVSRDAARTYWPAALFIPVGAVLLRPAVFAAVVNRVLRVLRRPPLGGTLSARGLVVGVAWLTLGWLLYGLHVWALARELGGSAGPTYALSVCAFALAWTVGFLVVVVPAGAGVRDVSLAVVLAQAFVGTPTGRTASAAGVALLSRLVLTVADIMCASFGAIVGRRGAAIERGQRGDHAPDADDDHVVDG
jgi:hypothetical protein